MDAGDSSAANRVEQFRVIALAAFEPSPRMPRGRIPTRELCEGFAIARRCRGIDSYRTDAELVARSVAEPTMFGDLYERHSLAVRRYVVRRIGDAVGDDVAAEVFVRGFGARGRYRAERDSALPWLLGIANNVIADHRRLERRRRLARTALQRRGLLPDFCVVLRGRWA